MAEHRVDVASRREEIESFFARCTKAELSFIRSTYFPSAARSSSGAAANGGQRGEEWSRSSSGRSADASVDFELYIVVVLEDGRNVPVLREGIVEDDFSASVQYLRKEVKLHVAISSTQLFCLQTMEGLKVRDNSAFKSQKLRYSRWIYVPDSEIENEENSATSPDQPAHCFAFCGAVRSVVAGFYSGTVRDAVQLAAYHVYSMHGGRFPAKFKLKRFVCRDVKRMERPALLTKRIRALHERVSAEMATRSCTDAERTLEVERAYLAVVKKTWPTIYGATFVRALLYRTEKVHLGVGYTGIHVIHGKDGGEKHTSTFAFEDIAKWTLDARQHEFEFELMRDGQSQECVSVASLALPRRAALGPFPLRSPAAALRCAPPPRLPSRVVSRLTFFLFLLVSQNLVFIRARRG